MDALSIPAEIFDRMLDHCRRSLPDEGCGLLAGLENSITHIYEMPNSDPSPVSYFMDPSAQFRVMKEMREKGLVLSAIFHSHPGSPAYPSPKDISLAFYEEAVYLIVGFADPGTPEVRGYRIVGGKVSEVKVSTGNKGQYLFDI